MENKNFYKQRIRPFDLAVEWLIKGANIGLIYGLTNLSEVPKTSSFKENFQKRAWFVWKNSWQTGCVLGTWWFFMKTAEIVISQEHWGNYSVAGVLTMVTWQKVLEIPGNKVLRTVPTAFIFSGVLGMIIISNT
jgi:hypothetical protein